MDDFILINESKDYLEYCLKEIIFLLNNYKLTINSKTMITNKKQGICFLGYRFYHNKIYILSKNRKKIYRKLKVLKQYNYPKYVIVKNSYKGYLCIS